MSEWVGLYPSGRGKLTTLNRSGAATNWQAVRNDDGDTSFVYVEDTSGGIPGVTGTDFYACQDLQAEALQPVESILRVRYIMETRVAGNHGGVWYQIGFDNAQGEHLEPETVFPDGSEEWVRITFDWATNPLTAQPWEVADLDGIQLGHRLRVIAGSPPSPCQLRTTHTRFRVEYEPVSQTAFPKLGMGIGAVAASGMLMGPSDLGMSMDRVPLSGLSTGAAIVGLGMENIPRLGLRAEEREEIT